VVTASVCHRSRKGKPARSFPSDAWLVRTQPGTVACSLAAVQIALEGAQKVKELCYIHAEGCAT
jgi:hypothetical protein